MSVQVLPDFDQNSFLDLYKNVDGNLRNFRFYTELSKIVSPSKGPGNPNLGILLNQILGVNAAFSASSTKPVVTDMETFYNNWSSTEDALENATLFVGFFQTEGKTNINVNFQQAYAAAQEMSNYILKYYFFFQRDENSVLPKLVSQTTKGYYPQTDSLYTFFRNVEVRGIANPLIQNICNANLSQFTQVADKRRFVSLNPPLLDWCGCFTPPDPVTLEVDSSFPPECDPLCVNDQSINLVDSSGIAIECNSTVCVISDVSLNVAGSTNRQYDFQQICNACESSQLNPSSQPCRCIIDSEFSSVLSKINANDPTGGDGKVGMDVGLVFERYCPNSVCYVVDRETGSVQSLECNKLNPAATGQGTPNNGGGGIRFGFSSKISFDTISLLSVILLIVIFMCLMLMIKSQKRIVVATGMKDIPATPPQVK